MKILLKVLKRLKNQQNNPKSIKRREKRIKIKLNNRKFRIFNIKLMSQLYKKNSKKQL